MATQPTNPIIKIAENDVNLPSTGQPNKNEPSSPIQTIGYDKNQVVTAEELNYILDNFSSWLTYLTEELEQRKLPIGHTDDRGENKTWVDGQTEGEYQHVQTESELAQHNHTFSGTTDDNTAATNIDQFKDLVGTDTGSAQNVADDQVTNTDLTHNHAFSGTTDNTGSSSPMNNTQPSIAVYRWKRTS